MVSAVLGRHGGRRMKKTERAGQAGVKRCEWALGDPVLLEYHDAEWGVPKHDDRKLFEFLVLEGVQAGLSWLTVLKKRENYRRAFDGFDPARISRYDSRKVRSLLADAGIIRNRTKIAAAIGKCEGVPRGSEGVRELRCVHLAVRRRWTEAEPAENPETNPGSDKGIGPNERGPQVSRFQVCRFDDLLCVHASRGDGERPPDLLLPEQSASRQPRSSRATRR